MCSSLSSLQSGKDGEKQNDMGNMFSQLVGNMGNMNTDSSNGQPDIASMLGPMLSSLSKPPINESST